MGIYDPHIDSRSLLRDAQSLLPKQMFYPVRGMVIRVNPVNEDTNSLRTIGREYRTDCSVLVMHGGGGVDDYILGNVIVPSPHPLGATSDDDYNTFPVKGLTVDGKENTEAINGILESGLVPEDQNAMNGDMVIVQFIGGDRDLPFISGFWPHPLNSKDPNRTDRKGSRKRTSSGALGNKRSSNDKFSRSNKVETLVDEDGSVSVSTVNAKDGSVNIDLKAGKTITISFEGQEYLKIRDTDSGVQVSLGSSANAPAVVGDVLATIFDNHTHTCAVGPTSAPMPVPVSVSFSHPVTGEAVSGDAIADPPIPKKPSFKKLKDAMGNAMPGRLSGSAALSTKVKVPHN